MAVSPGGRSGIPVVGLRVAMAVYGDIRHDSRVRREAASLAAAGHHVTLHCLGAEPDAAAAIGEGVRVRVHVPSRTRVLPGSESPFRLGSRSRLGGVVGRIRWLLGYAANLEAWGGAVVRDEPAAEVWHLHDFAALAAIAWRRPPATRLVYDVHDLFLGTGSGARLPGPARALVARLERRWARRADVVVTVNDALARMLADRLGLAAPPVVVHNCPARVTAPAPATTTAATTTAATTTAATTTAATTTAATTTAATTTPDEDAGETRSGSPTTGPNRLRALAGIAGSPDAAPVVLHHGLLARNRGLEALVEAIRDPRLAGVHLVLLGDGELRGPLATEARSPAWGGRLHVLDPVPPERLLDLVIGADVGAIAMPPVTENLRLSTPNKLFECLAAGVPVVVSDLPTVRAIVCDGPDGPLGTTCDPLDPGSIAGAIAAVVWAGPADRAALRARCARAAHERWNWETEVDGLLAAYAGLAARSAGPARARAFGGHAP